MMVIDSLRRASDQLAHARMRLEQYITHLSLAYRDQMAEFTMIQRPDGTYDFQRQTFEYSPDEMITLARFQADVLYANGVVQAEALRDRLERLDNKSDRDAGFPVTESRSTPSK